MNNIFAKSHPIMSYYDSSGEDDTEEKSTQRRSNSIRAIKHKSL